MEKANDDSKRNFAAVKDRLEINMVNRALSSS